MKTLKLFSIIVSCLFIANIALAQSEKKESFNVSGECGMCKKKIEKAAKEAGASSAVWSPETKLLKVSYDASATNTSAIQKSIAKAGYDTPQFNATDDAYNSLEECCKYERQSVESAKCNGKCEHKEGKCNDMAACKDKGCHGKSKTACCKKS